MWRNGLRELKNSNCHPCISRRRCDRFFIGTMAFSGVSREECERDCSQCFPRFLRWMPGAKDIIRYDKYKEFADKLIAEADVICCLDFNALSRIDAMADAVAASKGRKMMVDHHLYPGDFCRIVISHPEISSTSELVFRLICRLGYFEDITKEGAECIYTGMMTDTGGFTYNSNNREIYFIISELLSKGIDKDEIYRNVYNTYSEGRLHLMGYVLYDKMQVFPNSIRR